jgi:hypothetical protein
MSISVRRVVLLALIALVLVVSAILSTSAEAHDEARSVSAGASLR